jgi:hypothetical protein
MGVVVEVCFIRLAGLAIPLASFDNFCSSFLFSSETTLRI